MPVIRELLVGLGIKADQKAVARFDESITSVKKQMVLAGAAAVGLAAGLFAIAKSTAAAGDDAAKQSQRIGITAEAYQELAFAAELTGTSIGSVQLGMKGLARLVGDFELGTKSAADTVAILGVRFRDDEKQMRPIPDILGDIADKFVSMEDGFEKSNLAQRVFTKAGADMINFLNSGSAGIKAMRLEARELGFVLDASATKASEEFNDSMSRLKFVAIGVRNTIGKELMPIITQAAAKFTAWWKANRKLVQGRVKKWTLEIVAAVKTLGRWLRDLADRIGPVIKRMGGFEQALKALIKIFVGAQIAKLLLGLGQVILAIKAMGTAALIAGGKVAFVTAAVALLVLGLDDLASFVAGDDSLMGRFVKENESATGAVGGLVIALGELREFFGGEGAGAFKGLRVFRDDGSIDRAETVLSKFRTFLQTADAGLDKLFLVTFPKAFSTLGSDLVRTFDIINSAIESQVLRTFAFLRSQIAGIRGLVGSLADPGAVFSRATAAAGRLFGAAAPAAQAGRSAPAAGPGGGLSVSIGAVPVTVNSTNTGASAEDIGNAAANGAERGLQSAYRLALANVSGAEQ